ncbi:PolC-type DNA polymerase III [Anaeromusa acidaminophila]|uniref:PolC-type DNA polymerase III n=1 Tax=Anaeromusa acidaminophila TaxID=81464 RepID=UPI0003606A30|nr:PolC-type DNA polymerase III [Anaeromusa acidaminophila]
MHQYCIIPESQDSFLQFLQPLVLPQEEKARLCSAQIAKVDVDTQALSWVVHLEVECLLAEQTLQQLARSLCQGCGLKTVRFVQRPGRLEDYLQLHWPDVCELVSGAQPALKRLLTSSCWEWKNECLTLNLQGSLAAELAESQNVAAKLQHWIAESFQRQCRVICNITQAEPVAAQPEEALTPEYLAALEMIQDQQKNGGEGAGKKSSIFFGRSLSKEKVQPLSLIQDEEKSVIVEGELSQVDIRELRTGRFLMTFDVGDPSGGIAGKVFFDDGESCRKAVGDVKDGLRVRLRGKVQYDKFSNDLVLFADSMNRADKELRQDTNEEKRIELHAHTRMSNMDGMVSAKELIKTAARWGHPAIAITDHGVVQSFPEAQKVAGDCGIKVIYGMEGYLFEHDINQARHIVILAKNQVGLRNLYRLVSISHLKYLHRTPRIPRSVLVEHREGLILGSACEAGELIQAIVHQSPESELLRIAEFYDYLEIQPIGNNAFLVREGMVPDEEGLRNINRKVCELAKKAGKPVVATGDVHFLNPEDEVYRRILMAGKGFSDADHQPPLYMHTTDEMLAEFSYLGKAKAREVVIEAPQQVSSWIEDFKPIPNRLFAPEIPGAEESIRSMSYAKAREWYGEELPKLVEERLEFELKSIIGNGFAVLYLIAHKLVKKSLDDGYLVGSRGSVGSSFVATMSGITEVNPLPPHWRCEHCLHSEFVTDGSYGGGFDLPDKDCPQCGKHLRKDGQDIPFAVFMGFNGDKVPDIDLNFSGDYQPVAHKYTEELFGKDNVFRAGTIATVADKTAYGFVKNYFNDRGQNPRNAHINCLVSGCTGVRRTTGQHPGGITVVPRDMDVHQFTPIQRPADDKNSGTITTHFDYHSIDSCLVKLDILGHDDPTVIRMLEDLTGIDAKTIPFDDPVTMSLFSSTDAVGLTPKELMGSPVATFGIPEFGTKFVRQMLEDTLPTTFSELVRISGFSHGTDVWLNNAQDLIKDGTAKLSEAISARDDIMIYLIHKGVEPSVAFKIMEGVRKGKGITPENVAKMKEKDVPDWYVESCQKIKYMFPKAHAVAYVMMAFRIAWFKVHHPLAFYAAYFTVRATEFDAARIVGDKGSLKKEMDVIEAQGKEASAKDKALFTIMEMAMEMYLRGFSFKRIDLYESDASKFRIVDGALLPPLGALQGVGGSAALNLVASRCPDRPFTSQEDLKSRSRVSSAVIEALRNHGCLEGLPESNQLMLFG